MKAGFVSLGCAKNLVDTEVMLGVLDKNGIELTNNPSEADILIINTCAFIQTAKEESITTILNMADYKNSGNCRSLIVAGCLGQRYGEELLVELPEVDAILGTGAWERIMEAVEDTMKGRRLVLVGDDVTIYDASTPRILTTPNYTAYIKIAEGCDHHCTFCAIPLIRGSYRSRHLEDILNEARLLANSGVKEIILIAQDSANYGVDLYKKPMLASLLKELCLIEKIAWIRVLYVYPKYFNDELIEVFANEPKVVKYIDLPLQHAHDSILRAMHRPDTKASMEELIKKLRDRIPNVAIRSTFIVGFPGETDTHYQVLRNFLEEQRFDKVGVFTYSEEEDTLAAQIDGKVPEAVMQERYHDLMSLQSKISEEINTELEGSEIDVLIEGRNDDKQGVSVGRSYREAPEIDGQVYVEGDTDSNLGDIIRVRLLQGFTYDIVGEKIIS